MLRVLINKHLCVCLRTTVLVVQNGCIRTVKTTPTLGEIHGVLLLVSGGQFSRSANVELRRQLREERERERALCSKVKRKEGGTSTTATEESRKRKEEEDGVFEANYILPLLSPSRRRRRKGKASL